MYLKFCWKRDGWNNGLHPWKLVISMMGTMFSHDMALLCSGLSDLSSEKNTCTMLFQHCLYVFEAACKAISSTSLAYRSASHIGKFVNLPGVSRLPQPLLHPPTERFLWKNSWMWHGSLIWNINESLYVIDLYRLFIFNLFSFLQIKFLKTKEGSAMVQLGDPISVDRAIQNLNNSFFFGSKLQLG